MNELEKKYRPKSDDPDFWEVWTRESDRQENWGAVANEWQGNVDLKENGKDENPHTDTSSNDNLEDNDLPF